jgi:undecaprenyl-diphosphatase
MKNISKHKKMIIGSIAIVFFILVARRVLVEEITFYDKYAYDILVCNFRNEYLTMIMKLFTYLCSVEVLLFLCVFVFLFTKNRMKASLVSVNLITVYLINTFIKYIVQRPRPEGYRLISENGYSFPSGHSMVAMAFYGYVMYLVYKHDKVIWRRNLMLFILGFIIIMIGVSRVYLGVHYASDVIGGFFMSIAYLMLFITFSPKIVDWLKKRIKHEKKETKKSKN